MITMFTQPNTQDIGPEKERNTQVRIIRKNQDRMEPEKLVHPYLELPFDTKEGILGMQRTVLAEKEHTRRRLLSFGSHALRCRRVLMSCISRSAQATGAALLKVQQVIKGFILSSP